MKLPTLTPLLLLLASATTISALENITSVPLSPGTCQGFPGYVPEPIGSLTQQFFFEADSTSNSTVNGLRASLSSLNSSSSELILNTDPTTIYNIFTCSGNGSIVDIHGGPPLVLSSEEKLDVGGTGLNPEAFLHEIGGVVQDGLFLGQGNVTTWGFENVVAHGESNEYYRMRLLVPGVELQAGELAGFVRIYAL